MEIEIMPERLLNDDTAIKFLNRIRNLDGIAEIMLSGPRYEKRAVFIGKNKINLILKISKFWLVVRDDESLEHTLTNLKDACNEVFHFGYRMYPKRFIKKEKSLCDYLYGGPPIIRTTLVDDNDEEQEKCIEFDSDFYIDNDE